MKLTFRTRNRRSLAAVPIAAAAVAAILAAGGSPSAAQSPQTLTVLLKERGIDLVRHGGGKAKGDTVVFGDGVVLNSAAFDESGKRIGTVYVECTNLGRDAKLARAHLQCLGTYDLAEGQVIGAGTFRFTTPGEVDIAVLGGTGSYRGISGPITSGGKPPKGYDGIDVITLDAG